MQHRHRRVEAIAKSPHELRRQANLRYKHQRTTPLLEHALHKAQIHFGLTATGDAVENERTEVPQSLADRVDSDLLLIPKGRARSPDGKPRVRAGQRNL